MFIAVTRKDGKRVAINSKKIEMVEADDDGGCKVWFAGDHGGGFKILQSFAEFAGLFPHGEMPREL